MRVSALITALAALFCFTGIAGAKQAGSQRELNGFFIGQHISVLGNEFGKPVQEQTNGDYTYRVFRLKQTPGSYMVFSTHATYPEYILGIQLSGSNGEATHPFLGLRLGDVKKKVLERLGQPGQVRPVKTRKKELWEWGESNVSLQIADGGGLVSIKINGFRGFPEAPFSQSENAFQGFKAAVRAEDREKILSLVMPDLEVIYGGREVLKIGEVFKVKSALRKEIFSNESKIMSSLLRGPRSLKAVFRDEKPEANMDMRLYIRQPDKDKKADKPGNRGPPGKGGVDAVYKFPASKILSEIVFTEQAGKWRVWDVKFR